MPIPVICPGCKASFTVHDKFAGKRGPCPKCKTLIEIPNVEAPKGAAPAVTIHAPEEATGGAGAAAKGAGGRPVLKPLERKEVKLSVGAVVGIVVAVIVMIVAAWLGSSVWKNPYAAFLALVFITPLLTMAGYSFMRNPDKEVYAFNSIIVRSLICSVFYLLLWVAYYFVPAEVVNSGPFIWFLLAPPFLAVGAITAYGCYELDFGNAAFHYAFYVVCTLGLGWLAGLPMPW